jgi:hypothetical protein
MPDSKDQSLKLLATVLVVAGGAYVWSQRLAATGGGPRQAFGVDPALPAPPAAEPAPPPQGAVEWRPSTAAERKAALTPIRAQLDAFKRGNFEKATAYQSAGLKQSFASVEQFRRMMERSYPQFVHLKSVTFGAARSSASGEIVQIPATVMGEDGRTVQAAYVMIREGSVYRVGSVAGGIPRRLEGERAL